MTLFSEGIASHYLLLSLIRELENAGILQFTQVDDLLQKAIERASRELQLGSNDHQHLGSDEMERYELEIKSAEKAIDILRRDLDILQKAREHR